LGGGTLATNYFADVTLTNQIANPLLTSISRTNSGVFLDPRPKAGSPASSDYAVAPNGLTTANYRGAFAPNRSNWAADWTALSEYGIMGGAGGNNPQIATASVALTPDQPVINPGINGGNLDFVFTTQTGFSYQLQSTTNLAAAPVVWADEGSAIAGSGSTVTSTVPASGAIKFFRMKVQ
jgi:hypothetical protein